LIRNFIRIKTRRWRRQNVFDQEKKMKKKILLVFILAAVITAGAFAQTDFASMPKNTIVLDFGPTVVGAAIGQLGDVMGEEGLNSSGFGIAAQYERQLLSNISVAGKIGFLAGGLGMTFTETDGGITLRAKMGIDISSFTMEGHFRFYPFGEAFFLDAMLGYANLTTELSGTVIGTDKITGQKGTESVSITAIRNYLNFGTKIGWRISFGKRGGFTFEPSFGYYYGVGLGDTIGQQLASKIDNADESVSDLDEFFALLEDYVFIGGPRMTLSFGWRF
jgi:hypothetical protein